MSKKIELIIIIFIIIIAGFLRLYQIGSVPPSPDWDEASLGYNAYSIMLTGRDEYGKFLPVVMRSFDDYKPALYAYFVIPFIEIFGLNTIAVRLPSAIFGIIAVVSTYFLSKELFKNSNIKFEIGPASAGLKLEIPEVAALLLAISPWHLQFSRIGFETQVGLSLNILASLFFLKGFKNPLFLVLSFFTAALNFHMYQSEKVFIPLLFIALIIIYKDKFFKISKYWILTSFLVGFIAIIPLIQYILTDQNALLRAKGVSVFSDQTQFLMRNSQKIILDKQNNDMFGQVLDNRRLEYAKAIISGYFSHYDLNWLFISGDIARHHAPNMGLLYLFELPFLLIGIYHLMFGDFNKKTKLIIFSYFLIAPIPASVTSGVPHAVRTINFLPIMQIFIAIGLLVSVLKISDIKYQISNIKLKYLIFALYFLFFIFNFSYFLNQYFVQQNYFNSRDWQYGYEKLIPKIQEIEGNYSKIIVSNQAPLDQSYMFFLFYLKYPPSSYQIETVENSSGGFRESHKFAKFEFRPINWDNELKDSNVLYIGRPNDFSTKAKVIETINYLDDSPAIKIVQGND